MGTLFGELRRRAGRNARREIETYEREVPEYRAMSNDPRAREETLSHSVWLRLRTVELAPDGLPLTAEDLSFTASVGALRGEQGVSLVSHRRVAALNTRLVLREIHEATAPDDLSELMSLTGWIASQGRRGVDAYLGGYAEGQKRRLPFAARLQLLTRALLADEPSVPGLARGAGVLLHDRYAVTVLRVPGEPGVPAERRDETVVALWHRHGVPADWHDPGELTALVPVVPQASGGVPERPEQWAEAADERVRSFVRDAAGALGRPCSAGTGTGRVGALAGTHAHARHISLVAPLQSTAHRAHTLADVFVELGASSLPRVDAWLYEVARQLARGPSLIPTLDAYYRGDMNRSRAAAALNIHPRTLDYRLRRARELTGVDPCSTRGVRVLGTAVARTLAGLWELR
ncbi:hypothetical protein CUT44_23455 [Streptomyces carminius]|uniref:Uncharacterized protein n=1 Tax=Streptomyces carminius TaxID=2665496 RepID=A0A2M8LTZ4_9ACTN|nr:helix-turn-helix domain-containing protein [Streptomyces carminius]PJE95416.1 hypothetical protein CUT44_23455 [Streptomyces carminius]